MDSESVSWPVEFPELKQLDMLLKCGICYDYMKTCMITTCNHTFCSFCIRKFMQYKTYCPTCLNEIFENGLRNNRPLDDIIIMFRKVRGRLARAVRLAVASIPSSGGSISVLPASSLPSSTLPFPPTEHNQTKTTASTINNSVKGKALLKQKKIQFGASTSKHLFPPVEETTKGPAIISHSMVEEYKSPAPSNIAKVVPGMFLSSPKKLSLNDDPMAEKETFTCPVCNVDVPKRHINVHLDACLIRTNEEAKPRSKVSPTKRNPLPKRLYNLMSDKEVKKTLKDYGLSIQGERKALVARLQRFIVLYNSENDSVKPRPYNELLLQVEREEQEEKKPLNKVKSHEMMTTIDKKTPVDQIEKINKQYIEENKNSFKSLIENMKLRERKNIGQLKPAQTVDSDNKVGHGVRSPHPSTSKEGNSKEDIQDGYDTLCLEPGSSPVRKSINNTIGDKESGQPVITSWDFDMHSAGNGGRLSPQPSTSKERYYEEVVLFRDWSPNSQDGTAKNCVDSSSRPLLDFGTVPKRPDVREIFAGRQIEKEVRCSDDSESGLIYKDNSSYKNRGSIKQTDPSTKKLKTLFPKKSKTPSGQSPLLRNAEKPIKGLEEEEGCSEKSKDESFGGSSEKYDEDTTPMAEFSDSSLSPEYPSVWNMDEDNAAINGSCLTPLIITINESKNVDKVDDSELTNVVCSTPIHHKRKISTGDYSSDLNEGDGTSPVNGSSKKFKK